MTIRLGRNRLTKDLLRDLLRGLYTQYFWDDPEPAKRADRTVTQKEVAQWIQVQGAVAADPDMQPLKKLTIINAALLSKLDELDLRTLFTEAESDRVTAFLMAVVTNMDADTYHAALRDRVITYICKELLNVSPEDDSDAVQQAVRDMDKALTLLRFGEADAYRTEALLVFRLGWLASELDAPHRTFVAEMPIIETRLWELISPYHVES